MSGNSSGDCRFRNPIAGGELLTQMGFASVATSIPVYVKLFGIILIGLGLISQTGCNSQPRVSSPEVMQLIRQVYTACNTKNAERLQNTQSRFNELVISGTLTELEQRAFQEIFGLARDGNWEKAQDRAFSFAQSQVR